MEPRSYDELSKLLTGRCEKSRKLANHTHAQRRDDKTIAIKLHDTDILTFKPSGGVVLNTGGWQTVTTMERMNRYLPLPYRVRTISRIWYLSTGGWNKDSLKAVVVDGAEITKGGKLIGFQKLDAVRGKLKEAKAIREYARKYVEALAEKKVSAPNGGDCWMCYMETQEGKSLGDASNDTDHLRSHIEESYFVGSLMHRAITEKPVSLVAKAWLSDIWHNNENGMIGSWAEKIAKEQLQKALMRYLMQRLGFAG